MNNNLEDLFKNKFENFESKPNENLWNKIDKDLNKFSLIKTASIIASVAIVAFVAILFFYQNNIENTITTPDDSNSEITNIRSIVVKNDDVLDNEIISSQNATNDTSTNTIVGTSDVISVEINADDSENFVNNPVEEKNYQGFELSANSGCCPLVVLAENKEVSSKNLTWKVNNKEYKNSDIINVSFDKPGTYEVVLTREDDGMLNTYNEVVTVFESPIADFSTPEEIFENKTVTFENLSEDATSFAWYIDNKKISQDVEPSYKFSRAGTYNVVLIATNEQECSDTISKNVRIEKAVENIVFPTAFVPNKYGSNGGYYSSTSTENDIFYPVVFKDIKEYNLVILNKNGEKIFETNEITQGWDGYFKGEVVDNGVYVFYAKGTFADGEEFQKQGSITVYR